MSVMDTDATGPGPAEHETVLPTPALLRGWKEIAGHLDVSSRTAQRWANELRLPVHRTGQSRGSVAAYVHELDAWQRHHAELGPAAADTDALGDQAPAGTGDHPEASAGAAVERGRTRWPALLAAAAGVVVLAGVAAWSLDWRPRFANPWPSPAGAAAKDRVPAAGARPGAAAMPPGVALAINSPQGSVERLVVPDGGMGRIGITGGDTVGLEVSLREGKLHLTVYDLQRPAGADGSFVASGFFVIARPDPDAVERTRFEFADGWLEVAWVGIQ